METEREAKFEVAGDFRLPALHDHLDIIVRDSGRQLLEATYYDTASLDLSRWGVTLRFRTTRGTAQTVEDSASPKSKWTLKLPDPAGGGPDLMSRTELDFEGGPEQPPPEAQDLIRAHRRGRSLEPVCELTTTRTRYLLIPPDGTDPAAEIDDDSVAYRTSTGRSGRFREIEVELKSDAGGTLLPTLAARLRDAGGRTGSAAPKVTRALGWKPPRLPPVSLTAKSTVESVVSYAIADSLRRLLTYEPMVRTGNEPEPVHQARVATRRLRSDLSTLERLLKPKAIRQLRADLKDLGGSLGALRDTDVMLERLRKLVSGVPARDRKTAQVYVDLLDRERNDARSRALAVLNSDDYVTTVDHLIDAIDRPPLRGPDLRAAEVLPPLVAKRWKDIRRRVRRLGPEPADTDLHRVRIDAKRCRYAAELAAPLIGREAELMAEALADVQTVLGKLQDAVVLERWLRTASARLQAGRDEVAEQLIQRERRRAASARREWHKPWDRIADQGLADWLA